MTHDNEEPSAASAGSIANAGVRSVILKAPDDCPCDVFDANGTQIIDAIWADTETGEAVHLVRGDDGKVLIVHEDGEQAVKTEPRRHPAPLTYKSLRSAG